MTDAGINPPRWIFSLKLGRLQLGLRVFVHHGQLPDRWVFQPWLIFDRKRGGS